MCVKKILLVIFLLTGSLTVTMAQKENGYAARWKKVEGLEKKGLTKSARTEVTAIYKLAQKDNNDPQQIKAGMYLMKYRMMVDEDGSENNIFYMDTLIAGSVSPSKNILLSVQAELFWRYLQNNRWKFYDRTQLAREKSRDISTWSIEKLYATISALYKASLQNESLLKNTKLEGLDAIIYKGENTRQFRPTLYDLLAHRALEFFMDDESGVTRRAYQFKIDDPIAFSDVHDFIKAPFKTKDTASLQQKALLLLQDILRFHMADTNPAALIDADLIRLDFVNNNAVTENKDKLYEAALLNIEKKYPDNPASAQAIFLRAKIYLERGLEYEPFTKTGNQYEIKRARELFESVSAKFPGSEGGINSKNAIIDIEKPSMSLQAEKVNLPLQPFRTLVSYRNVRSIYFRVVRTTREEMKQIDRRDYEKLWKTCTEMKPLKSWSISLPDQQDYQQHSAEIKIDGLANGVYFILASIDGNFSLSKNIIARQTVYISGISYIHTNGSEYYVLDRDNGHPLANAQVQVWDRKYNYKTSSYEETKQEKYNTDDAGFFKLKDSKEYRSILLQVQYGNDELFMDNNEGYRTYNSYEKDLKPYSFLFTDRSIYRPGQTVYFKGIVVKKDSNEAKSTAYAGFKTKVILKDANFRNSAELAVTTNGFGSYKGSFRLPEGVMNGEFTLVDSVTNETYRFSVEEYKRPKFSAGIQKPKGSYRVNDSITVTGTAKAYAGNNIDGAKVSYRVVRRTQYPVWWWGGYFKIMPTFDGSETEITNGETTTDAKGEFSIHFKAIPDASVDKKDQPVFYYEVSADITDINGETRSGNTSVAVAYQSLQLSIDMPEKINADSLKTFIIRSRNMNDIFEKALVNLTFSRLRTPGKIFRTRYWSIPDQFVMSREEYYSNFPYDAYKDEDRMQNWPVEAKFLNNSDSTKEDGKWASPISQWQPGWYKIEVTTRDKYGEEVKAEKFIRLVSTERSRSEGAQGLSEVEDPVTVNISKQSAQPKDTISYSIRSGFSNVWLLQVVTRMDNKGKPEQKSMGSVLPFQTSTIVAESDRGGMALSYAFVKHNRLYSGSENFEIPWSNKDLSISYETFRDKLLPGSEEKWKVKISGNKGEKVAAEMLAGMYDASLDQFKPHAWHKLNIWPQLYNTVRWEQNSFAPENADGYDRTGIAHPEEFNKSYDQLGLFPDDYRGRSPLSYGFRGATDRFAPSAAVAFLTTEESNNAAARQKPSLRSEKLYYAKAVAADTAAVAAYDPSGYIMAGKIGGISTGKDQPANEPTVQPRKNFKETAFFFPDLTTDAEGHVEFSFTMPEALTAWKLMTLAHTKDLSSAYSERTLVTQKPLMVQPNAPRFMREGDKMEFSAKIVNMGDSELTGTSELQLLDAATNKPVDGWFKNIFPNQYFTVAPGQSGVVKFPVEIPFNFNSALTYRIVARSGNFSDGEEMAIPILTNRMLVTESIPLNLRGTNSRPFRFDKLLNSEGSTTISNHALTVEYTSNPAWYAVQALPYLMEYPYECAEQTFNRYYTNTLASHITRNMPKIKAVFEKWSSSVADSTALLSNLQKNQELKSALLEETPWVMDAQNENQQKKNIALLFDMVKMSSETGKAINKIKEMQSSNGGFTWFRGGEDDRYITQYIVTGIGHLKKLNALVYDSSREIFMILSNALPYLDRKIKEDYDNLVRHKIRLSNNNLGYFQVQYLYMRSFFSEYKIPAASQTAVDYYSSQAKKFWLSNSKYMQAMIALALYRNNDTEPPKAIIRSLKENAINRDEMGMYWKEWTTGGYYWHQAPIESQAMMIEAFTEIDKNTTTIDDLKTWLLKQKQTQNWKTTKATAEACYALLLSPSTSQGGELKNSLRDEEPEVTITLGKTIIRSTDNITEAGTGYFKKRIDGEKVKPEMGNINVSLKLANGQVPPSGGGGGSWGALYWQYFEDLDKIIPAETPLKLVKKLFIEKNSDKGPVLVALEDGAELKIGDKVKVRIELKVDRDMEYVHMKDMRAACMEPVNVLSEYRYQDGLGYYESTRDASTSFFFGWLNRGSYVFEYSLFVTHAGNFSNGITTIQCMYAPEFSAHSEGIRVNVE